MSVVAYRDVSQSMGQKLREYSVLFVPDTDRWPHTIFDLPVCLPIRYSRYILPDEPSRSGKQSARTIPRDG